VIAINYLKDVGETGNNTELIKTYNRVGVFRLYS